MPKVSEAYLESRKQQILDAAVACFIKKGLHQTTMQDIRQESGLSNGGIYWHFSSKEEIIESILAEWNKGREAFFQVVEQKASTAEVIAELVKHYVRDLEKREAKPRMNFNIQLYSEASRSASIEKVVRKRWDGVFTHVQSIIRKAQDKGEINPELDAYSVARVFLSTYTGLLLQKSIYSDLDMSKYEKVVKALFGGDFWMGQTPNTSQGWLE